MMMMPDGLGTQMLLVLLIILSLRVFWFHFTSFSSGVLDRKTSRFTPSRACIRKEINFCNVLHRKWMIDATPWWTRSEFTYEVKNHRRTFAQQHRWDCKTKSAFVIFYCREAKTLFQQLRLFASPNDRRAGHVSSLFIMLMLRIIIIKIHQVFLMFSVCAAALEGARREAHLSSRMI